MATYTDNYQLTKPTYAEQADIGVLNSNMNKIDEVMHSSQISLAPAYDSTKSYAEGDKVMYELLMYKCISPTTGAWDGSKWERTTASESGGGGTAELDILGEASGAVASFSDGASAGLAKCIAEIVPKQAGTGTPSPDNVRAISGYTAVKVNVAGKNLLSTTNTETVDGVTYTPQSDGGVKVVGTSTGTHANYIWLNEKLPAGNYILSAGNEVTANGVRLTCGITRAGGNVQYYDCTSSTEKPFSVYDDDQSISVYMRTNGGSTAINATVYPMIRLASEVDATFEPYKGSTTTIPLGQTVYGGRLNVLTGELVVTYGYIASYNGETLTGEWLSDRDEYTSGRTPTTGAEVVYELATPQTVQLTPQEVNSLLGQNNISADTGDIDIVYVKASAPIQPNPTGTPTATLKKLGIEGAVFNIPSGGGGSSGGINYSTEEQDTGMRWIDGKPIYQKTVRFENTIPKNSWIQHSFGLVDADSIINVEFNRIRSSNGIDWSVNYNNSGTYFSAYWSVAGLTLYWNYENASSVDVITTIQYTKITD